MGLLYALEGVRLPFLDAVLGALTWIGSETVFVAAALIAYWCFRKRTGYYLLAVGLIGIAVNQLLKIVCRVPRPWVRDPRFTIVEAARDGATGYSFPSGHTQNVTGTFGGVARTVKKPAVRAVCIAVVVLVGFSRMYLGVHYPTDVGFSLLAGLVLVFALYPVFESAEEHPKRVELVFGVIAGVSLAAALWTEFRVWPADTDASNLVSAVFALWMMAGSAAAAAVAAILERKYIRFDVKAPWWAQILKAGLGVACLLALRSLLRPVTSALLGGFGLAVAARYGLSLLFAMAVWPLTFPWFAAGCPLKKKT